MPRPLVAKHERPDGALCAQVEVPVYFSRLDAAQALALMYPDQMPLRGEREVRMGLSRAARERVLEQPGAAPDQMLTQAYMPVLDKHWQRLFKYSEHREWVGAGSPQAAMARFDVATTFSREEAAMALALVYEAGVPARFGRMTVERGLHQAAQQRALARPDAAERADAELVAEFTELLAQFGPWAQQAE